MAEITTEGRRVYVKTTYGEPCVAALKRLGAKWDAGSKRWWVGVAKEAQARAAVESAAETPNTKAGAGLPTASEHDDRRVYAKVKYKGSNWYVIAEARDKGRCAVCKLSGREVWVDTADCELLRTYEPREERGAYGRPTGRKTYTTLGSLRHFVGRVRAAESRGEPKCAACGRPGGLVEDLEDGLMKHPRCCDMPGG